MHGDKLPAMARRLDVLVVLALDGAAQVATCTRRPYAWRSCTHLGKSIIAVLCGFGSRAQLEALPFRVPRECDELVDADGKLVDPRSGRLSCPAGVVFVLGGPQLVDGTAQSDETFFGVEGTPKGRAAVLVATQSGTRSRALQRWESKSRKPSESCGPERAAKPIKCGRGAARV